MVLGNTFHLFITPGHEHIAKLGGLHRFMGWDRPIITDSGGFQVFSMGHGSVADEVKRRRGNSQSRILSIEEEGVSFRAYTDGAERFMGPETSMEVQAALGSDIALAFDECTPFHVDRAYTLRSMERTHRWLDRCVAWQAEHGRDDQVFYGIVQGGVDRELRAESVAYTAAAGVDGIAIGGTLGEDKDQMRRSWAGRWTACPRRPAAPAGHRRRGRHRPAADAGLRRRGSRRRSGVRGAAPGPVCRRSGRTPLPRSPA